MEDLFNEIESDHLSDAKDTLASALGAKVADAIDAMRKEIASKLTSESANDDDDYKESVPSKHHTKSDINVGKMFDRMFDAARKNTPSNTINSKEDYDKWIAKKKSARESIKEGKTGKKLVKMLFDLKKEPHAKVKSKPAHMSDEDFEKTRDDFYKGHGKVSEELEEELN